MTIGLVEFFVVFIALEIGNAIGNVIAVIILIRYRRTNQENDGCGNPFCPIHYLLSCWTTSSTNDSRRPSEGNVTKCSINNSCGDDEDNLHKDDEERQIIEQIQNGPSLFQFEVCYDLKPINNCYPMKSEPRGQVLIYNIINVKGYMERTGSEHDVKNINNLFLRLGYEVKIIEDCTADNFKKTLKKEITKSDLKNMDSFILFIMTHGTSNALCMQDGGKIQMSYVEEQLDGKNAPLLINKPKLIFVQACRKGPQIEHDLAVRVPDRQPHGKADIFISHSTYEGSYSARIPDKGTWFIRTLVKVLEKHAHEWSEEMHYVHRIVNEIEADDFHQIPQKSDSGRYNFFFSPIQIPSLIFQADAVDIEYNYEEEDGGMIQISFVEEQLD